MTVTVTGLTAERMLEIEAASVVDGEVVGNDLILTKHDGDTIDAGNVRGPQGFQGNAGPQGNTGAKGVGWYGVTADLVNISGVAGSAVGDYFVNHDTVNHTVLGVNAAPGDLVKSTSATAGTNVGSIRGPAGPQGIQGPQGPAGAGGTDATGAAKGIVQLAGDLGGTGGTAAAPKISDEAIGITKIGKDGSGLGVGAFSAKRLTAQSIPAAGGGVVWNAEDFDISNWFDTTTGLYTPLVKGVYRLTWRVCHNTTIDFDCAILSALTKNGVDEKWGTMETQGNGAFPPCSFGSFLVEANGTTDTFRINCWHGHSANISIPNDRAKAFFQGELVFRRA